MKAKAITFTAPAELERALEQKRTVAEATNLTVSAKSRELDIAREMQGLAHREANAARVARDDAMPTCLAERAPRYGSSVKTEVMVIVCVTPAGWIKARPHGTECQPTLFKPGTFGQYTARGGLGMSAHWVTLKDVPENVRQHIAALKLNKAA